MPRDDSLPATGRSKPELTRARAALLGLGGLAFLLVASLIYRQVTVQPGTAQRVVISRGGEVVRILGPGDWGIINPWSHSRTVYDMAITAADRSLPDRGMPALSAEGHPMTVFGTAFWHEGEEADLRWRFTHIRADTELMQPLMASAVQAVIGRLRMDEIIRDANAVQSALTEELRRRARDLLRVQVTEFALTRIDPGESYRAVVAEREIGRARADSVAASPAVASNNQNAVDVELIRRWDGRGVIPETMERRDRRPPERR